VISGESLAAITPPVGNRAETGATTGLMVDDLDDADDVVTNPGTTSRRSSG